MSRSSRASILVLALLMMVIFVILGFTIVSMNSLESREAAEAEYSEKALYMADAGIQYIEAALTSQADNQWRDICPDNPPPSPAFVTAPCCAFFRSHCASCNPTTPPCICPNLACNGCSPCPSCNFCGIAETRWIFDDGHLREGFQYLLGNYNGMFCHNVFVATGPWCYQIRSTGTVEFQGPNPPGTMAQRVLKAYISLTFNTVTNLYSATETGQYEDFH